jgi:endonuclease YncB( thermonuclease family)
VARLVLAVAVALLACAATAVPAPAATRPCVPGAASPRCTVWTGKATFVADGDTVDVDVAGDGTRVLRRIRLTGLNAMEMTRYSGYADRRRGACHAVEATARLERLLRRGRMRVRLAAQDPASRAGSRLRRHLSVRIGGRWVDAGRILLAEGHALWLPNGVEHAWNRDFRAQAELAAARRLRLYDASACGPGPSAEAALELELNFDAAGRDDLNPDGEWMRVRNRAAAAVPLAGWWLRDSSLRRFTFPAGTVLAPGGAVTVHVGRGAREDDALHWGLAAPAFENPTDDRRAMGDGAYLFDPEGDLRAGLIYGLEAGAVRVTR